MMERRLSSVEARIKTLETIEAQARANTLRHWLRSLPDDAVIVLAAMAERVQAGEDMATILATLSAEERRLFDELEAA